MSDGALGDLDLYLFNEGRHARLYDKLGAHRCTRDGQAGVHFAVWAPDAERVSVIGDFNGWNDSATLLAPQQSSGIWDGFAPGVPDGARYKYRIVSRGGRPVTEKADPLAFHAETPPCTASIVWNLDYEWGDADWLAQRGERNGHGAPIAIYEVHLGSWRRVPEDGNRSLSYRELAPQLAQYVQELGFTHVELLPVMEHPFYGSWGYQVTGFFAATSRYGTPQELMYLIDVLHQHGIGVILDWVPAHFPRDAHGLGLFDGTHLYEHADPRQGVHPDWDSLIFNYGRNEVRSFLLSAASFWLDRYHVDGLRVDGVASMLYLDYSRQNSDWVPNHHGGRENLEAISLLRQINETLYAQHPGIQMFAEESTDWSMVSRPTYVGGLGFGFKWDMGWMHDTLVYITKDPVHRRYHHNQLTFRGLYAFTENFVLPLSHDEVAHGKGSLLSKMPGDDWQKFANLRLLLCYMWLLSGKKLLFMGGEFGQWAEWNHDVSLDWHQAGHPQHQGIQRLVRHLNGLYRGEPALHADCDGRGFTWVDANDADNCVLTFLRRGGDPQQELLAALNFTPVPRHNYRVGVDRGGAWRELLNSDAVEFGGSGHGNFGGVEAVPVPSHGRRHSLTLTLPPLAAVCLKGPVDG